MRLPLPSFRKGRRWVEDYATFECQVVRVRGPVREYGTGGKPRSHWIYADVYLPQKYSEHAIGPKFNPDGTYPVEVVINHNRKTLEPFLASGDLMWDVREEA